MISREELKIVLQKNNFDEDAINRILNKRIKKLLNKGKKEEIDKILKVLEKHGIEKEKIENCLSVLAVGKAEEIEKIFEVLKIRKIGKKTIEKCLYVLAYGKAEEIEKIFEVLEKRKIGKETIENCLNVLAQGKADEIEKIFKVLEKREIRKEALENCLSVLAIGKADEIEKIFEVLEKRKISKEKIEKCLYVLVKGKADEIEKIFEVLEKRKIRKETIENGLYVLAQGKAEKIEKTFEVLEKRKISKEAIEKCLYVLAQGKTDEIEKILEVLEKREIKKETIEKCLYVLARGKADEIEKIFEVLEKRGIKKETIEKCLTVLALGKADEIEKIFEVLEKRGIKKETIENCLYVFVFGKSQKIEKIFDELEKRNIRNELIEENLKQILRENKKDDIINVFEQPYNESLNIERYMKKIKLYLKLTETYNRKVTIDEVEKICNERNITKKQFIKYVIFSGKNINYLSKCEDNLNKKGEMYIGNSIPVEKKFLQAHSEQILELSKRIARNFAYKYKIRDIDELESQSLEIIVSKCGNIAINLEEYPNLMYASIYNKTIGYLKAIYFNPKEFIVSIKDKDGKYEDLDGVNTETPEDLYMQKEKNSSNKINIENFDETEKEIWKSLLSKMEEGIGIDECFKQVAEEMDIEQEELLGYVAEIKEKILQGNQVETEKVER